VLILPFGKEVNDIFKPPVEDKEIMAVAKPDRRRINKLQDKNSIRNTTDRRRVDTSGAENEIAAAIVSETLGKRYMVDYEVVIKLKIPTEKRGRTYISKAEYRGKAIDISNSGILLKVDNNTADAINRSTSLHISFEIIPGTMPEGYEMKINNMSAKCLRITPTEDGKALCGMIFNRTLAEYAKRNKHWYMLSVASFILLFVSLCVVLMRVESIIYFKYNKLVYFYSIAAAVYLLSQYLFASFYRPTPIDPEYTPGVSVIIPCFNEEKWIERTIISCLNQDYPINKLEVIVVDDCSSDHSSEVIKECIRSLKETEGKFYDIENTLFLQQAVNSGKRAAMLRGTEIAKHELLVFVDSDSFLDPFAVRNIVQPFKDTRVGGVTGRTDAANTYTNALTKMQSVYYYISFRVCKAAESIFDTVTCLSGPLSCYRKELVQKYSGEWVNQTFLGLPAVLGDDRALTNYVLSENRTVYQDTALCSTIVPNSHKVFLKQQLRWQRSWFVECLRACGFIWKKEPFAALSFYLCTFVTILAAVFVAYNMFYVPIVYGSFPFIFLLGLFLMALLVGMTQLLFRKSTTWFYGLLFCAYYLFVLLWLMPYAWFTFWKSNWGTRPTAADIKPAANAEAEDSTNVTADVAKEVAATVTNDTAAADTAADVKADVAKDNAADVTVDIAKDNAADVTTDVAKDNAADVTVDAAKDNAADVKTDVAKDNAASVTADVAAKSAEK
jgi:hyaluronan synthase